ncbi:MAG: YicC/YloC family endoribonuclease [Bacteroidales bacterium]
MIKSMTGYGKSIVKSPNGKFIIELKSLNGKNCDVSIKSQIIPRDKELEVRKLIKSKLERGNIDLFINEEFNENVSSKTINAKVINSYLKQLKEISAANNIPCPDDKDLIPLLIKMPDVIDNRKEDLDEESWNRLFNGIKKALEDIDKFRIIEGQSLKKDISLRVHNISSYVDEVEKYEKERIDNIKDRLSSRIKELGIVPDNNRLEQEIIFYIEKLDINEEKVRLRQHCKYFLETIEIEGSIGKKLGFISQEMGREINTMGSKANHSEIQQWVVKMKDELEKIKEQSLNIL